MTPIRARDHRRALPRALAAFDQRGEWSSLFVALAMCAGSVLLIDDRRPAT
jgi:hypothetical protein